MLANSHQEKAMSSIAGQLLLARPTLRDGFFGRTVILMLQHGDEGAFGLVLNRPAQAENLPFPVFVGGPCKMDGLLMIHGREEWLEAEEDPKMQVCPGVYLGTAEHFEKAAESNDTTSEKFRVFVGYAGWGPTQLEAEMQDGSWIVLPATGDVIFDTPAQELWERLAPPTLPKPSMN
jgi:putative transcriptional regulator